MGRGVNWFCLRAAGGPCGRLARTAGMNVLCNVSVCGPRKHNTETKHRNRIRSMVATQSLRQHTRIMARVDPSCRWLRSVHAPVVRVGLSPCRAPELPRRYCGEDCVVRIVVRVVVRTACCRAHRVQLQELRVRGYEILGLGRVGPVAADLLPVACSHARKTFALRQARS